jgi:hypothetical protein
MTLAVALIGIYMPLQTLKWKKILELQGFHLGFLYLLKVHFIGMFYGMLTPGRIGTLLRISYIRDKTKRSFSECSSNVVLDKLTDVMGLLVMGTVGIILLLKYVSGVLFYVTTVFLLLFLIVFLLVVRKSFSRRVLGFFYRMIIPAKYKKSAAGTFSAFYDNMPGIGKLAVPLVLMFACWILVFSSFYIILLALGINNVPYHVFITVFAISTMIGLIPVTISGWGMREASLIATLSVFGVTPEKVIALSIIAYAISGIMPGAIGALFAFTERDGNNC